MASDLTRAVTIGRDRERLGDAVNRGTPGPPLERGVSPGEEGEPRARGGVRQRSPTDASAQLQLSNRAPESHGQAPSPAHSSRSSDPRTASGPSDSRPHSDTELF